MFQDRNLTSSHSEMRPASSRSNSGPLRKKPRMPEMRTSCGSRIPKKAGLLPTPYGQGCELDNKEVKLLILPNCGCHVHRIVIGWSRAANQHHLSQFPSGQALQCQPKSHPTTTATCSIPVAPWPINYLV